MLRRCKCSGVHSRSRRLGAKAMRCAVVAWSCDVRTRRGRDDEFLTSSMWPRLLTSSLWPRPTDGARFFFSRKRALPRVARCSAAILPHSAVFPRVSLHDAPHNARPRTAAARRIGPERALGALASGDDGTNRRSALRAFERRQETVGEARKRRRKQRFINDASNSSKTAAGASLRGKAAKRTAPHAPQTQRENRRDRPRDARRRPHVRARGETRGRVGRWRGLAAQRPPRALRLPRVRTLIERLHRACPERAAPSAGRARGAARCGPARIARAQLDRRRRSRALCFWCGLRVVAAGSPVPGLGSPVPAGSPARSSGGGGIACSEQRRRRDRLRGSPRTASVCGPRGYSTHAPRQS